jgi:hypothetical protein
MDTELLEAEELDVDQTRSARHERPASPRFPPLLTFKRLADDLRFALAGPSARDHQLAARHERYGHAGDPWKNGP